MRLRLVSLIVVVAFIGSSARAAERATFILTDGERKSGPVVFHGDQRENLINGYLNLGGDGGKDLTFPLDQVAVIDFVGGQPPTTELSQLGTAHLLVLRNGAAQQGRLVNLIGGDTLLWENEARQRQQYAIRDVSRIYLNPSSARTVFGYVAPAAQAAPARTLDAPGTTPPPTPTDPNARGRSGPGGNRRSPGDQPSQRDNGSGGNSAQDERRQGAPSRGVTVRVSTGQGWTDSGLTVERGDRLTFESSAPVRGLVARIGTGTPFEVELGTEPLVMGGSGRLMLGVNEDGRRNVPEAFSVNISRR